MPLRALPFAVILVLAYLAGCGSSSTACDGDTTEVCHSSDHASCFCAPTCDWNQGLDSTGTCEQYIATFDPPSPSRRLRCDSSNLCIPSSWPDGTQITIEYAPQPKDAGASE